MQSLFTAIRMTISLSVDAKLGTWNEDEDVWIVISKTQVRTVIAAMERVLKQIETQGT
jgi:hypothetical protein